jgi:hypothetical protein
MLDSLPIRKLREFLAFARPLVVLLPRNVFAKVLEYRHEHVTACDSVLVDYLEWPGENGLGFVCDGSDGHAREEWPGRRLRKVGLRQGDRHVHGKREDDALLFAPYVEVDRVESQGSVLEEKVKFVFPYERFGVLWTGCSPEGRTRR